MNLFDLVVPADRIHPNFRSILLESKSFERAELQRWAEGFPDRDGKLVKEFQTTFNSSFWEIYLYALLRDFGFEFDWSQRTPDFNVEVGRMRIAIEATTANASQGKPAEWEHRFSAAQLKDMRFAAMNRESIIRLSNSILSKIRKYRSAYAILPHVAKRPFVLAVAPFEQPHFNLQYNRPIVALLYDYYVDEDAFLDHPSKFPDGPPSRSLGFVTKENGSEVELGYFNDDQCAEISAVVFSCTATWGKVDAMAKNPIVSRRFETVWGSTPDGVPVHRSAASQDYKETIQDGLQVYHNPYARYPIDPNVFRRPGVVQVFADRKTRQLIWEGEDCCLMYRMAFANIPDLSELERLPPSGTK